MTVHRFAFVVAVAVLTLVLPLVAGAQAPPPDAPDGPEISQAPHPPTGPDGGPDGHPGLGPPPVGRGKQKGPVTAEAEKQFLAFIKQNDPAALPELERLKARNPTQYRHVVGEGVERMRFLEMLKRNDPTAYQGMMQEFRLESNGRALADSYRKEAADKKAALKEQLRQVLNQLFDVREVNRKRHMERLEKDLERMKTRMQQRAKNKSTIVNRKLDEMLMDSSTAW